MKFGVIDIGSNSVRLMLSDGDRTLYKLVKTTKLSKDMADGYLSFSSVERTINAIYELSNIARKEEVDRLYAFATAAVRRAKDKKNFVLTVKNKCDLDVQILSEEEECTAGYTGALLNNDGGVIDIGGASSEIAVINNRQKVYEKSLPIGAVILCEKCGQDKNANLKYLSNVIPQYGKVPKSNFYCIGGTATTVASMMLELKVYDSTKTDGFIIKKDKLVKLLDKISCLSVEERKNTVGLQPERAEIILSGISILLSIMSYLNLDGITVSEKDNLEGFLILKRLNKL